MGREKLVRCDVAVVGSGILGSSIIALAAQRGYDVRAVRLEDPNRPCSDTQRNQGWLQSGLMYIKSSGDEREHERILSRQMFTAGRTMLKDLELPLPSASDRGIMRLKNEVDAALLEDDARFLRIAGVERLSDAMVKARLGEIYEDGIYYLIPDAPFPEDKVLARLREIALRLGADLIHSAKPARLVADSSSESGIRIECRVGETDYHILAKVTIAAAGAGNLPLLQDLGVKPAMTLRQTPLLVLHQTFFADVPIFADRVRKFSFVRHPPEGARLPDGALVIGTGFNESVTFHPFEDRQIDPPNCAKFAAYLPPILRKKIPDGRFTAGYEVVPDKTVGVKDVEPWIEWVSGYPRLLKATPGRATMGMYVARQVLDQITSRIGGPSTVRSPNSRIGVLRNDDIFMHYHPSYKFNDSK